MKSTAEPSLPTEADDIFEQTNIRRKMVFRGLEEGARHVQIRILGFALLLLIASPVKTRHAKNLLYIGDVNHTLHLT